MRWRIIPALMLTAVIATTGCSDDKDPFEPGQDVEHVAGVYDIRTLTFDPNGSLEEKDIAARLDPNIPPQLVIGLDRTFQIAFIDPVTRRIDTVEGTLQVLTGGVRLNFATLDGAQRILLPRRLDLELDQEAGTLSFTGDVDVSLARLIELVPEFEEEQLRDPVRGTLTVKFTRRASANASVP